MAVLFDNYLDMTIPGMSGYWTGIDLSATPFNLPSNAVGIIAIAENTSISSFHRVGLRKNGSTDNYYDYVSPGAFHSFFIGTDSQIVDCYSESDDTKFWLVGYFDDTDAEFFTNSYDKTPSLDLTWQTKDLIELPFGSVAAIFYYNAPSWGGKFGCRMMAPYNSTLFNWLNNVGGGITGVWWDSGIPYCDVIASEYSQVRMVGYLKQGTFNVDWPIRYGAGTPPWVLPTGINGVWQTVDVSATAPVDAVGIVLWGRDFMSSGTKAAVRSTSSTDGDYFYKKIDSEVWFVAKLDSEKKFQIILEDATAWDAMYVVGYILGGTPPPPTPTNEELMRHMKWFHNGVFQGCWIGGGET